MTYEEKLKELDAERLAIQAKINAYSIVKILENKQQDLKSISVGMGWGRRWLQILLPSQLGSLKHSTMQDILESQEASLYGNPPMKLRLALAKAFREHYEIEETQDDR